MKVVNISLDPKILDPDTPAAHRAKAYGELVERYTIVVPTPVSQTVHLSDKVVVYGVGGSVKSLKLWRLYRKLATLAKAGQCDVIVSADMYFIGYVALLVSRRHHLGLEIDVLGIEKLSPLRKRIAERVLTHASFVRALSQRLYDRLRSEFGITHSRMGITSIYVPTDSLGLDVRTLDETAAHNFSQLREAFRATYGHYKNFLTVSRLVPIKRIELQLQAIATLRQQVLDVRLHIVGDGPEAASLQATATELGVADVVVFHGRKTGYELGVFYFECDCFLLTSDYEGYGMVIVEAATAGLPVIMTDVGCAGEFLIDGESGMVVPVNDAAALATAMERIATDAAWREQLSYGTKQALGRLESFDDILTQYRENWERAAANQL